jgi:hypothetical protein
MTPGIGTIIILKKQTLFIDKLGSDFVLKGMPPGMPAVKFIGTNARGREGRYG